MPVIEPNYDEHDMVIPPVPVNEVPSAPPAPAEKTDAAAPSPIPDTKTPETPAPVEKTADAVVPEVKVEGAPSVEKPEEAKFESEEEKELKVKFSRPTDKGDEWQIRAYRDGQKVSKKLGPVQEKIDAIGSPERVSRGLDLIADLGDPNVPIAQADAKMTALSPSRSAEYRNYVYNQTLDQFPDTVLTHLLGDETTLAEVVEAVNAKRTGEKPQPVTTKPDTPVFDVSQIGDVEGMERDFPGLPNLLTQMAAELTELRGKVAAPVSAKPEDDPIKPVRDELNSIKEERRQEAVNKVVAEIEEKGSQYYADVMTVVDEGLRALGLEPDPAKDDEATIKLKTQISSAIKREVEPAFDAEPENQKLMERVIKLLANRDPSADDYKDLLKAKADLAFQKVADTYVDLYNAKRELQSTAKINDKPKHERPEIVGSKAAPNGKPAWLANKPAGMTTSAWLDKTLEAMPG